MNLGRFAAATAAQLKMTFRARVTLFWALLFPIILMTLLGLLFGGPPSGGTLAVVDAAHTPESAAVVRILRTGEAVDVERRADAAAARADVADGDLDAVLVLRGERGATRADLRYAATSAEAAGIIESVVRGAVDAAAIASTGRPAAVTLEARRVESDQLDYVDFLMPGIIAIAIMVSSVYGIATVLVDWRTRGILRRLRLTPMPLSEFLASRVAASLVVTLLQLAVLLAFGRLAFDVHIGGSAIAAVPVAIAGSLCFLSLGFLVGSLASRAETADAVINVITNPMMFLSGTFVPVAILPDVLERVARALPLYYLAAGLRDTTVRGASLVASAGDVAVLLAVAAALAAASVRVFRWEPAA